jgi:hypothetical protein
VKNSLKISMLLILAVFAAVCLSPVQAATREYEIKAGFIYNFFRFVEWPSPGQGWTLGIMGSDPFEGGLRDLEAKPLNGKSIKIRKITDIKEAKGCDALYLGPSEASKIKATLNGLKGNPILTISDIPEFADKGGAIGLTTESNRIRFIVNIDTLKHANMRANARFLQLASRTITASETPESLIQSVTFSRPGDEMLKLQDLFKL